MNQDIRFCTANDGVKLAYAVTGDGPPLVMASTWLTHLEHQWRSLAWRPWLDAFQAFTVLRHDSRGCGLSDRDTDNLSFENWVSDFACVVDAAGFDRFPIVATCWGGPVAIEYAARYPERVSHLVLYGTYARGRFQVGQPEVTKKARLMLELTRQGWGQENNAFKSGRRLFSPVAHWIIYNPGLNRCDLRQPQRRRFACLKLAGARTCARRLAS
jgi:pimeloyl-ACP methyl ester carboxylesterase